MLACRLTSLVHGLGGVTKCRVQGLPQLLSGSRNAIMETHESEPGCKNENWRRNVCGYRRWQARDGRRERQTRRATRGEGWGAVKDPVMGGILKVRNEGRTSAPRCRGRRVDRVVCWKKSNGFLKWKRVKGERNKCPPSTSGAVGGRDTSSCQAV